MHLNCRQAQKHHHVHVRYVPHPAWPNPRMSALAFLPPASPNPSLHCRPHQCSLHLQNLV